MPEEEQEQPEETQAGQEGQEERAEQEERARPEEQIPPLVESMDRIKDEGKVVEGDMATGELFDTQRTEGHTFDPYRAQDQGLTYTPPDEAPLVPSDKPQRTEVAAGMATEREAGPTDRETLPARVYQDELELRDTIYEALHRHSETAHLTDLQVEVKRGVVHLRGTVFSQSEIDRVYAIAADLAGRREVRNHLEIQ